MQLLPSTILKKARAITEYFREIFAQKIIETFWKRRAGLIKLNLDLRIRQMKCQWKSFFSFSPPEAHREIFFLLSYFLLIKWPKCGFNGKIRFFGKNLSGLFSLKLFREKIFIKMFQIYLLFISLFRPFHLKKSYSEYPNKTWLNFFEGGRPKLGPFWK